MQTVLHYLTLLLTGTLLQAQTTVEVPMTLIPNNEENTSMVLCTEAEIASTLCLKQVNEYENIFCTPIALQND